MTDIIHKPSHYRAGTPYETFRVLEEWLTPDQLSGFYLGNVIKYVSRADLKGNSVDDLKKAAVYLQREIDRRMGAA